MTTSIRHFRGVILWKLLVLFTHFLTASSSVSHIDHSITLRPRSDPITLPYTSCIPVAPCTGIDLDSAFTCLNKQTAYEICQLLHPSTSTSSSTSSDSGSNSPSSSSSPLTSSFSSTPSAPSSSSSSPSTTTPSSTSSSSQSSQNVATTPSSTPAAPTFNSYVEASPTTSCIPAPSGCGGLNLGDDERCLYLFSQAMICKLLNPTTPGNGQGLPSSLSWPTY